MARPDIFTADIFRLADLCIEAGFCPGLEEKHYVLVLYPEWGFSAVVRRAELNFPLPRPCRVWLVRGKVRLLLGDSASLPADLSAGVGPPFVG